MARIEDGRATRAYQALVDRNRLVEAVELALRDELGEDELRRLRESNARKLRKEEDERLFQRALQEYEEKERSGSIDIGGIGLSTSEEQAVDAMMADYAGGTVETPATDLSEGDRGGAAKERAGRYFGVGEMLRVATEDTGELPEHMREDAALQDELRRQAHKRAFGEDSSLSDDELWAQYRKSIGEDA
jgi:hypothetical protein